MLNSTYGTSSCAACARGHFQESINMQPASLNADAYAKAF